MDQSFDTNYTNQVISMPYEYEQIFLFLYYAIFLGIVHWYVYYKIKLSVLGRAINQYVTLPIIGYSLQFLISPEYCVNNLKMKLQSTYNGPFKAWLFNKSKTDISSVEDNQTTSETLEGDEFSKIFSDAVSDVLCDDEGTSNAFSFVDRRYEQGSEQAACSNSTKENCPKNSPTTSLPFNPNALILNCLETLNEHNVNLINRLKKNAVAEKNDDLYSHVRPTSIMETCKTAINHISDICKTTDDNANPPPPPNPNPHHTAQKLPNCRTLVETLRKHIEIQIPNTRRIFENRPKE